MTPGDLDQRVRIDARQDTPDGQGGSVPGWTSFVTVWAKVVPVPGRMSWEKVEGGELRAASSYRFTIRRRSDLDPTMRVVWPIDAQGNTTSDSLAFNIRFDGTPSTRELYQIIDAEAGVAL